METDEPVMIYQISQQIPTFLSHANIYGTLAPS